jgi:hypothetical protein
MEVQYALVLLDIPLQAATTALVTVVQRYLTDETPLDHGRELFCPFTVGSLLFIFR